MSSTTTATTTDGLNDSLSNDSMLGIIIGASIAGCLLVTLSIVGIVWLLRRRSSSSSSSSSTDMAQSTRDHIYASSSSMFDTAPSQHYAAFNPPQAAYGDSSFSNLE
jgi:hypothetical protein